MKKLINKRLKALTILLAATLVPGTMFANLWKGKVVGKDGAPVEFATVLVMNGDKSVAGTTTNEKGEFNLNAPAGNYKLRITSIGFKDLNQQINVKTQDQDFGTLTLEEMSNQLAAIEVKANYIKREADRFVVDVANAPSAIGKDGYELLKESPSVFVKNDEVTVYGSAPAIYVNERRLTYSGTQLENYLRSLKAADIQKIEIVPQTGADYDANSAGGVIKITLKHRRNAGVQGETGGSVLAGKEGYRWTPYFKMTINKDKYSFYYNLFTIQNYSDLVIDESTHYFRSPDKITAKTDGYMMWRYSGGDANFVYDIDNRRSVGATVEYNYQYSRVHQNSATLLQSASEVASKSRYYQPGFGSTISATANYIDKLDSLGSTFKVFADYTRNHATDKSFNNTVMNRVDSTYNYNTLTTNTLAALRLDYEKVLSPKTRFKAGGKYSFSKMESLGNGAYDAFSQGAPDAIRRGPVNEHIFDVNYKENVAAAYATYTANLGRINFVAGLRGEYTMTDGKGIDRNYFDLFPNVNLMYAFDKNYTWMITGQYSRTIERPNFWMLNPSRMQISDYTYREGDPFIEPGYTDSYGVTLLFKQKYSFTLMLRNNDGKPQFAPGTDPSDPHIGFLRPINTELDRSYIAAFNAPITITKWWTLNANINAIYYEAQAAKGDPKSYSSFVQGSAQSVFTLPKKTFVEIDYNMMSYAHVATIVLRPYYGIDLRLKRKLCGDRLTLSATASNLLFKRQVMSFSGADFSRRVIQRDLNSERSFKIEANFSFGSNKKFKNRRVETGDNSDKGRFEKNN